MYARIRETRTTRRHGPSQCLTALFALALGVICLALVMMQLPREDNFVAADNTTQTLMGANWTDLSLDLTLLASASWARLDDARIESLDGGAGTIYRFVVGLAYVATAPELGACQNATGPCLVDSDCCQTASTTLYCDTHSNPDVCALCGALNAQCNGSLPTFVPCCQPPMFCTGFHGTCQLTAFPTRAPTNAPTVAPTKSPTAAPTKAPTNAPTAAPTPAPSAAPTNAPTTAPSAAPTTQAPTNSPTQAPTTSPTNAPTTNPTNSPTSSPTDAPTAESPAPTEAPTPAPTASPTSTPTVSPTGSPTGAPTESPTRAPTESPTNAPTESPTTAPTESPTSAPTGSPTRAPTSSPTESPTEAPTSSPTDAPTASPTPSPTSSPTDAPTQVPLGTPTEAPTPPTASPTTAPTTAPTQAPTTVPTATPTRAPTTSPTQAPSVAPTGIPTAAPTSPTTMPTDAPTEEPTAAPTEPVCPSDTALYVRLLRQRGTDPLFYALGAPQLVPVSTGGFQNFRLASFAVQARTDDVYKLQWNSDCALATLQPLPLDLQLLGVGAGDVVVFQELSAFLAVGLIMS